MLQGNTVANVNIDRGSKKIIRGKYSKNNSYLELKQESLLYCSEMISCVFLLVLGVGVAF